MNNLRVYSTILLAFFAFQVFAQDFQQVIGIVNSEEGELPNSTIVVRSTIDSSLVKAGLSDVKGSFILKGIPPGDYFLEVSMIGYKTFKSAPFTVSISSKDLGIIKLIQDEILMKEVNIAALKPMIEVEPDRTVFNVANTINASGSDGFELLRKAPGVVIDNSNNLIVEGKSGVLIFIDNKASQLSGDDLINFLRSMQASDIEKIEIITQPSSKYDAEGNAGIINIILKRNKNLGTNGTFNAGYRYGYNHRTNASLSLNNRGKKTNVFGNYSNQWGKSLNYIHLNRLQENVFYDSRTENTREINSHNGRFGLDYYLNSKHTIGILGTASYYDNGKEGLNTTTIRQENIGVIQQRLLANNVNDGRNINVTGNINYRFKDTLGHEFSMDLDYGRYDREQSSVQPNEYYDESTGNLLFSNNYTMYTPTNINIYTIKADYSQNAFKGTLSFGGKYSLVETDNTFDFYNVINNNEVLDTSRSNQFNYSENINAVYVNYGKRLNAKWNLQLGLRVENTISEGDLTASVQTVNSNVKRNYIDYFPSGGLTFNPNRNHSWAFTFSRRIQRPNYASLNPFERQANELSFVKGNPFLQPQYTLNTKLAHTFKYRFTTSISYSFVQDFFAQISDTIGSDKNFLMSRNVADKHIVNLGMSYPFAIKKWWDAYLSINTYYASYVANDAKYQPIEQTTVSIYAQNSFLLPKDFKFQISGWFNSPSVWGGTYRTRSHGSLDLALQKKLLDNKLSLQLAFNDIFRTAPWVASMRYGGLDIKGTGGWESRVVAFNLTYNFGNKNVKAARKRNTGLEEESKRTSGE